MVTQSLRWIATVLIALLVAAAWSSWQDASSEAQARTGLERALGMYAISRALNAVVSVAQGTRIEVEPAGIGAEIAVGEALRPVHEIIEQFSAAMLAAAGIFGLQLLLIKLGSHWLLNLLMTVAAGTAIAWWWYRAKLPRLPVQVFMILVLVRFAVPVSTALSGWVHEQVLASDYQDSVQALQRTEIYRRSSAAQAKEETSRVAVAEDVSISAGSTESSSLASRFSKAIGDIKRATGDVKAMLEDLSTTAKGMTEAMVRIAVLFVVQTLVLPLLFGWALIGLVRTTSRSLLNTAG